jgi:taste receptor type 2
MPAELFRIIKFPWMVTNHFSLWLATSLSIFYFLKIANFSNSTFLYLKWRVKKVVLVVLLMSLVFLLLNIVLVSTNIAVKIEGCKTNLSYHSSLRNSAQFSRFQVFIYSAFYFIPFTVFLTTFLLLVFSMWKHLKKMQQNAQGSRDASTIAHIKALQTVIAFLLLYTVFFITLVVQLWTFELQEKNLIILFCQGFGIAFPSCHSFILILRNSKLRQASLLVLWWLRCRSKDVETLSP